MERNKVTVNGILQSVYLKNVKVLTVKDSMSSNFWKYIRTIQFNLKEEMDTKETNGDNSKSWFTSLDWMNFQSIAILIAFNLRK